MHADHLPDIERIKQLKARYCRYLDTKDWAAWRTVFTDDFHGVYTGPHPDVVFRSGDEIVAMNREILRDAVTVHQCHQPEITLTGPDSATGIWAMFDIVRREGQAFHGYGHYHEEYRRGADGEWRVARVRLTRLAIEPQA